MDQCERPANKDVKLSSEINREAPRQCMRTSFLPVAKSLPHSQAPQGAVPSCGLSWMRKDSQRVRQLRPKAKLEDKVERDLRATVVEVPDDVLPLLLRETQKALE